MAVLAGREVPADRLDVLRNAAERLAALSQSTDFPTSPKAPACACGSGGTEQGEEDGDQGGKGEALTEAQRTEKFQQLKPAIRRAFLAYKYAESSAERRLEDREA